MLNETIFIFKLFLLYEILLNSQILKKIKINIFLFKSFQKKKLIRKNSNY